MFWDPVFDHASSVIGAPPDQVKIIASFLFSYPLAILFVRIPPNRPNLAHLFSLVIAAIYLVPLLGLGTGLIHLLISCFGTYVIVVSLRSANMPWVVFVFVMGHLLLNHLRRKIMGYSADVIDITGSQMVLAMKLITFAWNVHDGRLKAEDLDASQLATRLQHVPSPLPFLGYCFFFPSFLVGPSFDYSTYDSLIKHTIYDIPPPGTSEAQVKATKRRVPHGRKRVAYLHLVLGLVFLGVYAVYGQRAAYSRILTPTWYTWGWLTRFGFIQLAGFIARTKYYALWSLTEGACILTGIGFNGYDPKTGRTLWNRVRNINILSIETAESFKVLFDSWNCRTNVWLRDCVYKRLVKKGKKPGTAQSMATFVTSAFWHGVEPGYYLAFIMGGLVTSLGRQFRRFVRPYFLPPASSPTTAPNSLPKYPYPNLSKRVYDVLGWSMVQINLNFIAGAFILLGFNDCIRAWHRMGWYSPILVGAAMIFFRAGGRRALKQGLKSREQVKEVPSFTVSPPSPMSPKTQPHDELDSKDLRWIKHAFDNPPYQDDGPGVGPDAGVVDSLMQGTETPGSQTPKTA
ncbi:MBOAT, membrane-bound O-acyltransferase family-domain-containing protein [Naematelia encephala]|uniref:MBOAT, membrane-bound O-acyltransferase family-domain-containing protein n=1 Tax=Naematelia encephala TaxID=71784 RepID=A0A1Y2BD99_9TREE|nr:MBOAT, membrane-bound O-acyltransferase family-domain-containing protein [Naematelia encephala]